MTEEKTSRRRRKDHMNTAVVLLAIMICLVIIGSAGHVVYTQSRPVPSVSSLGPEGWVQSGILTNQEGEQVELDAIVREGVLTFTIDTTLMMRDGKSEANLVIENPPDNGNRFTVAIVRKDTGEEIYKSGYLDPEQCVRGVPLDVELLTGEYRCIADFDAYRISDNTYIGGDEAQATLYVQNWQGGQKTEGSRKESRHGRTT